MKRKYFIVSDVHSFYDEMLLALDKAGYQKSNPEHFFILCGDLFDRGTKPAECLEYVMNLPEDRRIFIRGNHEDLLEELVRGKRGYFSYDVSNGTIDTIKRLSPSEEWFAVDIATRSLSKNQDLMEYFKECRNYYETKNYVFVHGWIPNVVDWRVPGNADKYEWEEARWFNGMARWKNGHRDAKTIVCGHWHTSWGHHYLHKQGSEFGEDANFGIFEDDGIIAIDACTAHSGKVNVLVLEEEED